MKALLTATSAPSGAGVRPVWNSGPTQTRCPAFQGPPCWPRCGLARSVSHLVDLPADRSGERATADRDPAEHGPRHDEDGCDCHANFTYVDAVTSYRPTDDNFVNLLGYEIGSSSRHGKRSRMWRLKWAPLENVPRNWRSLLRNTGIKVAASGREKDFKLAPVGIVIKAADDGRWHKASTPEPFGSCPVPARPRR